MFIIHLGNSGFPLGNAQMQRIRLTFKSLKRAGFIPLVINKHSVHSTENSRRINRFQGIPYVSTSVLLKRPNNFFIRNLNKISGISGELLMINNKRKKIGAAIYYGISFSELVYYRILSKIFHFKLIIQYVELRSSVKVGQPLFNRINNKLFDRFCVHLCDGIIVISEYLKNIVINKNENLPYLKIPAICDFEEFENEQGYIKGGYLMYCGAIGYLSVIEFIIDLYCKLRDNKLFTGKLMLAIGVGYKDAKIYNSLIKKINNCNYHDSIELNINVPHNELISHYLAAELLIVPLRNELQDIAGFHHKIGEYTASGRPFMSTNLGEVKYYFRDGTSAILADEYNIDAYADKFRELLVSDINLEQIGQKGHQIGLEHLNYAVYSSQLKTFIMQIIKAPVNP